jgi:hypothetical protein
VKEKSRIRLATAEDIERAFGPAGVVFGIPVRPKPEPEHEDVVEADDEPDAE